MLRRCIVWFAAIACVVTVPSVCWAAGDAPNIFKGAVDLAIWTVLVFLILLVVLAKMAWKPMMEGLAKRESEIKQAAADAKAAKEESEKLRGELQIERDKAAGQIRELMDKARKDAERLKEEIEAQGRAQVTAERDRLYRELGIAKDQALQDIYQQGVELASILSTKTIHRSLTPEDHRGLVDEALADLRSSAQERQRVLSSVS